MYEVLLERAAERDLKSLSVQIFQRILPRIKSLAQNPRPSGCHKLSGSRNDWRIRVGDYRIIYEIKERG
ncbi:MAG: type II toxin-antitoxin system RelE/ParE family toxin [Deltaproteobacteria bacterium]|nr:type II toxin-antitoxin system RelE/ParE family toxin [Deltaproteobacteria bacterium]